MPDIWYTRARDEVDQNVICLVFVVNLDEWIFGLHNLKR